MGGLLKAAAGLITLSIAVFGFVALDLQERWFSPEVNLVMPPEARLLQKPRSGGEYLVRVHLQPAFASTGRSQRVEVLKSFQLFMEREGQQQCKALRMDGVGSFTNNPDGAGLAFIYESGASPLMVTYDTPQAKVLVFELEEETGARVILRPFFGVAAVGTGHTSGIPSSLTTPDDEPIDGSEGRGLCHGGRAGALSVSDLGVTLCHPPQPLTLRVRQRRRDPFRELQLHLPVPRRSAPRSRDQP
jgi:hypothetical protein